MAQLTGGTFKYTRRIKPGDPNEYNAPFREATAELTWSAGEDATTEAQLDMMESARRHTVDQVHKMLGKAAPSQSFETNAMAEVAVPQAITVEPAKAIVAAPTQTVDLAAAEKKRPTKPGAEPPPGSTVTGNTPAADTDDLLGDIGAPPPTNITTEELLAAVTRKNAERQSRPNGTRLPDGRDGRSPLIIRELIGKYVQPPKTSRDIPQELRVKFLAELAEL